MFLFRVCTSKLSLFSRLVVSYFLVLHREKLFAIDRPRFRRFEGPCSLKDRKGIFAACWKITKAQLDVRDPRVCLQTRS
jgi:hypothetical protein